MASRMRNPLQRINRVMVRDGSSSLNGDESAARISVDM
jgi:hypothetical protein